MATLSGVPAPSVDADHVAIVYAAEPTDPIVPCLRRVPTFRERLRRSYLQYEIDTARHCAALYFTLPAQEEVFSFKVAVVLTWQVHEVDAFLRSGLEDVKPVVWGAVDQPLRVISRRHPMEHAGAAEEEMNTYFEQKLGDIDHGLRLDLVSLNVRLDQRAGDYLAARVKSRHARTLAEDEHQLQTLRSRHAALDAQQQGDLERAQVAHAAEIERLRSEHELALKGQRVEFYRSALRGDNIDVLIMHLIEHPQDVQTVISMLNEGKRDLLDRAKEFVKELMTNKLMNAADAESVRTSAFQVVAREFGVEVRPIE